MSLSFFFGFGLGFRSISQITLYITVHTDPLALCSHPHLEHMEDGVEDGSLGGGTLAQSCSWSFASCTCSLGGSTTTLAVKYRYTKVVPRNSYRYAHNGGMEW